MNILKTTTQEPRRRRNGNTFILFRKPTETDLSSLFSLALPWLPFPVLELSCLSRKSKNEKMITGYMLTLTNSLENDLLPTPQPSVTQTKTCEPAVLFLCAERRGNNGDAAGEHPGLCKPGELWSANSEAQLPSNYCLVQCLQVSEFHMSTVCSSSP